MIQPDRLLILANSRYDCLIMRRELADRLPDMNITTMTSAQSALAELENNNYDTLILELKCLGNLKAELTSTLKQIIIKRESMLTICLRSTSEPMDKTVETNKFTSSLTADHILLLTKDDAYEQQLPDYIFKYYALAEDIVPAHTPYRPDGDRSSWIDPNDLAGQLAHEINNPLMMITGTAELLLQNSPGLSGEVGKRLKIIMSSAGRIKSAMIRLKKQEQSRILPLN